MAVIASSLVDTLPMHNREIACLFYMKKDKIYTSPPFIGNELFVMIPYENYENVVGDFHTHVPKGLWYDVFSTGDIKTFIDQELEFMICKGGDMWFYVSTNTLTMKTKYYIEKYKVEKNRGKKGAILKKLFEYFEDSKKFLYE